MAIYGCLNKDTNQTDYVYSHNRVKNLGNPFNQSNYIQYEILDGTYPIQYYWNDVSQIIEFDESRYVAPEPPVTSGLLTGAKYSIQFSFNDEMDYDQFLVSWADSDSNNNRLKRSSSSNGIRWGDASPIIIPCNGKITKIILTASGLATSSGSVDNNIDLRLDLNSDMYSSEGTKLSEIHCNIEKGSNNIGTWWNTSNLITLLHKQELDISVNEGQMVALKFVRQYGSDKIIATRGINVTFIIEEIE